MWFEVCMIAVIAVFIFEKWKEYGEHASSPSAVMENIIADFKRHALAKWLEKYKDKMKELDARGFALFKMMGVRPVLKHKAKASRGYDKLMEIMSMTHVKISGHVLSLCCGRGGWEQAYAYFPPVTKITAVTYGAGPGHEGHENYTDKAFPGKEKVRVVYSDARGYPETKHDTLLFDGGESSNNPAFEESRFFDLFNGVVMRQINEETKNFVLKVLTPTSPMVQKSLKEIQRITGKGALYRVSQSRASTLELYFVSTDIADVEVSTKMLLMRTFERGLLKEELRPRIYELGYSFYREPLTTKKFEILEPLDMSRSIEELGPKLPEQGLEYNHWESLGVYPVGKTGSTAQRYNRYALKVLTRLIPSLQGFDHWKTTDTTPSGFQRVFHAKVDTPPKENHQYENKLLSIYEGMAAHFVAEGFVLKELTWEEVYEQANKQGAAGTIDMFENVGEFLSNPNWIEKVKMVRKCLDEGKPIHGVFNTIGKREKKKCGEKQKGSRMVAYLPIAMRLLELKLFGNLLKLTKPELNHFGVGGLGLHDLGMRINEVWQEHGVSDDIAGFDTRVGLTTLSLENRFIKLLGGNLTHQKMYRLYGHPLILVPICSEYNRSELLRGRGQRMSGSNPTYSMNTITRIAVGLLQLSVVEEIPGDELLTWTMEQMIYDKSKMKGCVSGDDATFMSDEHTAKKLACGYDVLDEIGMPRKDIPRGVPTPIRYRIEDVDFCSHHYEKVTFYDADTSTVTERHMPTRDVDEIIAKSSIRVGGVNRDLDDMGWISAQGNNLLVNYSHLRTVRAVGMAYKAIANPNVLLNDTGGFIKPTPWMTPEDVLDVANRVLFGESTRYPVAGFRLRTWSHYGYLPGRREESYDPGVRLRTRTYWRDNLRKDVRLAIDDLDTGGDIGVLDNWRKITLD
ncbi:NS5-like protein [Wuhan aphid virus 2]|uniref:NS5-like protein n=1 Tax=Wuhan aphid virus 2 TaxID=1746068 RepID=UPI000705CA23|nr:NS5-like protein [Wuhan aphid virus 2]ALL52892.1 NS5-like protein [Wuhan aphid virus 2]